MRARAAPGCLRAPTTSAVVITWLSAQASPITEAAGGLPPAATTITTRSALAISSSRSMARPATSPSHACSDQAPAGAASPRKAKNVARRHGPLAMRLTTHSLASSSAITLTARGCELGASMRKRASAALVARALSLGAILHRGVRAAGAHGERLARRVLERLVGRQHDGGRAHAVMRRVDAGRGCILLGQRLDGAQKPVT